MKSKLLKAGNIYAVRNVYEPCLLIDTTVHVQHLRPRGATSYGPAANHTPCRDTSQSYGFDSWNYGYLMVKGTPEALASVNVLAAHASLLTNGRPPETSAIEVQFVTSAAAILGPYARIRARDQEQREREAARRQEVVDQYNAIAEQLNTVLWDQPLTTADAELHVEPEGVRLTFNQASALANALKATR